MDFNELIHRQRGLLIKEIPKGAETVLSAGCAGSWYFDWFQENYGPVKKHIGLELYSERPSDLPDYVDWIENSVDDMSDIPSSSIDLLFSGQNIEHLDSKTLLGFLRESNRVLRNGGKLVIDSPNRKVTQASRYIQPEHSLELTDREMTDLLQYAGFTVNNANGIWSCRTETTSRSVNAQISVPSDPIEIQARCDSAKNDPEGSFIWWLVAEKTSFPSPELPIKTEDIYLKDYPGYVRSRFAKQIGKLKNAGGTESVVEVQEYESGYVIYGPYIPVFPGKYIVYFRYQRLAPHGDIHFDIVSDQGTKIHAAIKTNGVENTHLWNQIELHFEIEEYVTGLETRAFASGTKANFKFGSEILKLD